MSRRPVVTPEELRFLTYEFVCADCGRCTWTGAGGGALACEHPVTPSHVHVYRVLAGRHDYVGSLDELEPVYE